MIHYRSGSVTRPFSRVCSSSDGAYGTTVMLPTVFVSPDSLLSEFSVTRAGDSISTSKETNMAGDHSCSHKKLEGFLEGTTFSSNEHYGYVKPFCKFDGEYSTTRAVRTWKSSSGSSLCVPQNRTSGVMLNCVGPGILSSGSMTFTFVDKQYAYHYRYGTQTYYTRIECVGPNVFLWINAYAVYAPDKISWYANGRLEVSMELFQPTRNPYNRSQWEYAQSHYRDYTITSLELAQTYLNNPETYWSDKISEAISDASLTVIPLSIASLTYNVSIIQDTITTSGVATGTADFIAHNISKYADLIAASATPPVNTTWSDLCVTALQSCQQLNINSIAYAKDLVGLKSEISAIKQLVLGWKQPKTYLKAFLSYQYGVRLTMSDTRKLVSSLEKETKIWTKEYSAVRARSADMPHTNYQSCKGLSRTFNYKVYYNPIDNGVLNCIRSLMDWDLWPTLQNDWDLIPLSFVLDWFISVEDLCNRLDACIYSEYLDVYSVLRSSKMVGDISCDLSHYGINDAVITASWYTRTYSSNLDLPSFYLDTNSGFLTHLPELSSIIALLHQ